jgi:hypothetical protein
MYQSQDEELTVGTARWTIKQGAENQASYIVRGKSDFEFDLPIEHPDFVRQCAEPFEKTHKYKRPKEITENFIGSRNMWFMEVRC